MIWCIGTCFHRLASLAFSHIWSVCRGSFHCTPLLYCWLLAFAAAVVAAAAVAAAADAVVVVVIHISRQVCSLACICVSAYLCVCVSCVCVLCVYESVLVRSMFDGPGCRSKPKHERSERSLVFHQCSNGNDVLSLSLPPTAAKDNNKKKSNSRNKVELLHFFPYIQVHLCGDKIKRDLIESRSKAISQLFLLVFACFFSPHSSYGVE